MPRQQSPPASHLQAESAVLAIYLLALAVQDRTKIRPLICSLTLAELGKRLAGREGKESVKKVLSQEEINVMIRAARSGAQAVVPVTQTSVVTAWDGRLAGRMEQEQMQALTRLHQTLGLQYHDVDRIPRS